MAELHTNCADRNGKRMRITYEDKGPDDLGRRTFFLDWIDDNGRKRGQIFRAVPSNHVIEDQPERQQPQPQSRQ